MSLPENHISPLLISNTFYMAQFKATTVPPVSLTIPLGVPVVPEVSIKILCHSEFSLTKDVEWMIRFDRHTIANLLFFSHEIIIIIVLSMNQSLLFMLISSLYYYSLDNFLGIWDRCGEVKSFLNNGTVLNDFVRLNSTRSSNDEFWLRILNPIC